MSMTQPNRQEVAIARTRPPLNRRGLTTAELIVSAILLAATVSIVATGAVNMKRVQRHGDHYRAAVDYLSNVLAESELVSDEKLDAFLASLEIPEDIRSKLGKAAKIEGRVLADSRGKQIHLELHLDHRPDERPLRLVGFRYPSRSTESQSPEAEKATDRPEEDTGDRTEETPATRDGELPVESTEEVFP